MLPQLKKKFQTTRHCVKLPWERIPPANHRHSRLGSGGRFLRWGRGGTPSSDPMISPHHLSLLQAGPRGPSSPLAPLDPSWTVDKQQVTLFQRRVYPQEFTSPALPQGSQSLLGWLLASNLFSPPLSFSLTNLLSWAAPGRTWFGCWAMQWWGRSNPEETRLKKTRCSCGCVVIVQVFLFPPSLREKGTQGLHGGNPQY